MARGRKPKKQSKGLGDTIENITSATGIKAVVETISEVTGVDCGCDKRKEKLNKLLPYRLKVVNCPTEEQIKWYKEFQEKRTLMLSNEQRKQICLYYSEIFNVPYYEPCLNCSPKPYIKMIEKLDKVFKEY